MREPTFLMRINFMLEEFLHRLFCKRGMYVIIRGWCQYCDFME